MSGDDSERKFICDYMTNHKGTVRTYIQLKHLTNDAHLISRGLSSEWQKHFLDNTKIYRDTKDNPIRVLLELDHGMRFHDIAQDYVERNAVKPVDGARWIEGDPESLVKIERPPGHRLINVLQVVLPKSTFERVYGQMVADSREEYYEALQQGDCEEAKKIKWQLNYHLIISVLEYVASLPAHLLIKPFKLFDKGE